MSISQQFAQRLRAANVLNAQLTQTKEPDLEDDRVTFEGSHSGTIYMQVGRDSGGLYFIFERADSDIAIGPGFFASSGAAPPQ